MAKIKVDHTMINHRYGWNKKAEETSDNLGIGQEGDDTF